MEWLVLLQEISNFVEKKKSIDSTQKQAGLKETMRGIFLSSLFQSDASFMTFIPCYHI